MKNIKSFDSFNEGFISNIADAIKNKDAYHLFKSEQGFGNRSKIDSDTLKKLQEESKKQGLKIDKTAKSIWAYKEGGNKMEWNYDGEYIYYNDKYKKFIK